MKNIIYIRILLRSILFIAPFLFSKNTYAQAAINGPRCVTAGIIYQYMINGAGDSNSSARICVTGGVIEGSQEACKTGGSPFILIRWNDSAANGSISISTARGNASRNISVTSVLKGGIINSSDRTQRIEYDSIHTGINCSLATGGSCSPNYVYQWQVSADCLNWINIQGVNGQHLAVPGRLRQTSYFRRRVIETVSNSEQYSDVAIVFVTPNMEGHR